MTTQLQLIIIVVVVVIIIIIIIILSQMQTDILLQHKAENLLWIFPCLDESVRAMEFKAADSTTSWQLWSDVQIKGLSTMEKNKGDLKRIPEELKNFTCDGDEKVL